MTIKADNIPNDLRSLPQWVCWRKQKRHGKMTKVPYQSLLPATEASSTDETTWSTCDEAIGAYEDRANELDGIGFVFSKDDDFCGADFDNCLSDKREILPWAAPFIKRIPSYAEISPSGTGIKVFLRGKVPEGKGRKKMKLGADGTGAIEIYDRGRYFTVTGDVWSAGSLDVEDCSDELLDLHAELFPVKSSKPKPAPSPTNLSDREVLERIFRAKNGREVEALFKGDTGKHGSGSEADLALCSHLAFWTGGDVDAIDRLFRQSALFDDKWDSRPDYRERTILKALDKASFYDPNYGRNGAYTGNGHAPPVAGSIGPPTDERPEPSDSGGPPPKEAYDDPHRLARIFLETEFRHQDFRKLNYWNEEWHEWYDAAWRVVSDREINAGLVKSIKAEFDRIAGYTNSAPKPVSTRTVGNVVQALRDLCLLPLKSCPKQPAWIGRREPGEDWPDPLEILPTSNWLIELPDLADGGTHYKIRPTPRFFSPNCLGYSFEADAPPAKEWLGFLGSLWADDSESIECLQEWFGYCLTPDTSQQKILMMIGPKRSGKGTISRVLRSVSGPSNAAAPTLSSLATSFGLQPLIGKNLALIADARLSNRADQAIIVERLLSISGEDAQTIDRKHLTTWTGTLPTRFMLVSNELPRFADSSGAISSRMILLRLTKSYYGEEDSRLTSRILSERTSILRWAIDGWARLRRRGRFVQPSSGLELMNDLEELASPVGMFVAERCDLGPSQEVTVKALYAEWVSYCKEKGRDHPGDEQGFGRNLRAVLPQLKTKRPWVADGGKRDREYIGVGLKNLF